MSRTQKRAVSLALLFALNIALILFTQWTQSTSAAVYKQGSRGDMVRQIQTRLKEAGFLTDKVDGIYGPKTQAAVRAYQRSRGLTVDGICGVRTLSMLGLSASGGGAAGSHLNNDLELLARLVSAESRGEPYQGQVAVGAVVLNRLRHPSFPSTLSGVIYQAGAFSCLADGQFNQPVSDTSRKAAREAMNGVDPSGGAIYYFNPQTATSAWIWSRPQIKRIGQHIFCR